MDKLELFKIELELFHKRDDMNCSYFLLEAVFKKLDSKQIPFSDEIKTFCNKNKFKTYYYSELAIEITKLFNFIDNLKEKIA